MKTARWTRLATLCPLVSALLLTGACDSGREPPAQAKESVVSPAASPVPPESLSGAIIAAQGDLTGDGSPETVWRSDETGAHTTTSTFIVTEEKSGEPKRIPEAAPLTMPGATSVDLRGGMLRIAGGRIDSVGAGPWQREHVDTYAFEDGTLKRVARDFPESPTPYHRLLDGMWAERDGRPEQAVRAYSAAASMPEVSYRGYSFEFGNERIEGGENEELEKKFELAVKGFAAFRMELLAGTSRGQTPEAACAAARQSAGYDPEWLPYLNAPAGYANPRWTDDSACAAIETPAAMR